MHGDLYAQWHVTKLSVSQNSVHLYSRDYCVVISYMCTYIWYELRSWKYGDYKTPWKLAELPMLALCALLWFPHGVSQ